MIDPRYTKVGPANIPQTAREVLPIYHWEK